MGYYKYEENFTLGDLGDSARQNYGWLDLLLPFALLHVKGCTWWPPGVPSNQHFSNAMILWLYLLMVKMASTLGIWWPWGIWGHSSWVFFQASAIICSPNIPLDFGQYVTQFKQQRQEREGEAREWQSKKAPKLNPYPVFPLPRIMGWNANGEPGRGI